MQSSRFAHSLHAPSGAFRNAFSQKEVQNNANSHTDRIENASKTRAARIPIVNLHPINLSGRAFNPCTSPDPALLCLFMRCFHSMYLLRSVTEAELSQAECNNSSSRQCRLARVNCRGGILYQFTIGHWGEDTNIWPGILICVIENASSLV